jgi:threonine/homoserine efflux transporter RhtA
MHYLDLGIAFAVFAGIFWWMYALSSKAHAQRKLELTSRKMARQPWGDDRAGGRGNR